MHETEGIAERTGGGANQWLTDTGVVAACLVAGFLAVKTPWSPLPWPVLVLAGVLGSAAMWPRRRWPVLSAVAGAVTYALTGNPLPLFIGLYTGARYAARRHSWLGGIAAWAGYLVWSWLDSGRVTVDDVVFPPLGIGFVLLIGINLATRDALLVALREQGRQSDTERRLREDRARAAERTRIAREMHDVLAHKVSLIALYAGALELRAEDDPKLREGTALIRTTARETLTELREVLGVLRSDAGPPPAPGAVAPEVFADLTTLVEESERAGQPVDLRDEAGDLPSATARVVYRLVQEGLTNARKHAPAAPTTVSLGRTRDGSVSVTVDNKPAAAPADLPPSGFGLVGLSERLRLVGGSLRSGPTDDGWRLSAVVPWLHYRSEAS